MAIGVRNFSFQELASLTDEFDEDNFIGKFQFGSVFRGKLLDEAGERQVTVNRWEGSDLASHPKGNVFRLQEELEFLSHPTMVSHQNLMKVIGYCNEGENVGIVYDFKPLDTVRNLLLQDNFTWLMRIKVILQFARLLQFLDTPHNTVLPYVVRNIDSNHIMLDGDYIVKLIDFGMISGGIFPDWRYLWEWLQACSGYVDYATYRDGGWSNKNDVFAFGIVLLELIAKRAAVFEERNTVYDLAADEYQKHKSKWLRGKFSLVHESLGADPNFDFSDGQKLTSLAFKCVKKLSKERPTIQEIVQKLLKLRVNQCHAGIMGIVPTEHKSNFWLQSAKSLKRFNCGSRLAEVLPSFLAK